MRALKEEYPSLFSIARLKEASIAERIWSILATPFNGIFSSLG
jgi:hypothetical protein